MSEKKVLIITYYWPPSGGSGVQRWLKFVKYLPQFGWQPFVFTPENPSFDLKDPSLLRDVSDEAEIIHFPIWEPYDAFLKVSRLLGQKKSVKPSDMVKGKKKSVFEKFSTWVRGNLLIPDPRVFWVKPSVKFLNDFLRDNQISTVITTGPPHSMHLIGLQLKRKNPTLKWIADLRDPWSEWGFLDSLMITNFVRSKHKKLERSVLTTADLVTTITPFYVRHFERLGGRPVNLLTNGFDPEDFANLKISKGDKFVIRHMGIVNERCNPKPFMLALSELMQEEPEIASKLVVEFIGDVNNDFRHFIHANTTLLSVTKLTPSMPHKELIPHYGSSSLLLLVLTGYKDPEGYMPGKLFEYIATGLPVLGVGPEDGDAAQLLRDSEAGAMFEHDKVQEIKRFIKARFSDWKNDKSIGSIQSLKRSLYSRKAVTEQLAALLDHAVTL